MRWRGTARRVLKWTCTGACGLVVLACAASMWSSIGWWSDFNKRDANITLTQGAIYVHWGGPPFVNQDASIAPGLSATALWPNQQWRCQWTPRLNRTASGTYVEIPLWIPFTLSLLPAFLLWRADIRAAHRLCIGACRSCGYARAGLAADAKCPECGTVPAPAAK